MTTPDMALDALQAVRDRRDRIWSGKGNVPGFEALEEVAGFIACWQFGHPSQPRARRKWRDRPWRCERCGTWWITVGSYGRDHIWQWSWARVEPDQ